MKYLYTALCIMIAAVNLHGQATSFKLEGKNAAIYDGYKAYLYVKSDDFRKVLFLDSALLKDGKFNFAGPFQRTGFKYSTGRRGSNNPSRKCIT
jgi:hypothetical protein